MTPKTTPLLYRVSYQFSGITEHGEYVDQAGSTLAHDVEFLEENLRWMAKNDFKITDMLSIITNQLSNKPVHRDTTAQLVFLEGPLPSYLEGTAPTVPPWRQKPSLPAPATPEKSFLESDAFQHVRDEVFNVEYAGDQGSNFVIEEISV